MNMGKSKAYITLGVTNTILMRFDARTYDARVVTFHPVIDVLASASYDATEKLTKSKPRRTVSGNSERKHHG